MSALHNRPGEQNARNQAEAIRAPHYNTESQTHVYLAPSVSASCIALKMAVLRTRST